MSRHQCLHRKQTSEKISAAESRNETPERLESHQWLTHTELDVEQSLCTHLLLHDEAALGRGVAVVVGGREGYLAVAQIILSVQ